MAKTCVFCGAAGRLTAEHVFGAWLGRVGLNTELRLHSAGRLNRSLRDMGVSKPFTRTVRDVCQSCNNGWMANLEGIARRALTPLILGRSGSIDNSDRAAVALWTHKTALVHMLMMSDADEALGDRVLGRELRNLHAVGSKGESAPAVQTRFWIGRYRGSKRVASAWVTPMIASVEGLAIPEFPQAYVMTLVVGQVLLQGIRFTAPLLEFEIVPTQDFAQLWPPVDRVAWPAGDAVGDEEYLRIGKGLNLRPSDSRFVLAPWKPAVDLDDSEAYDDLVRLPALCGSHFVFYPAVLVAEARRQVYYSFLRSCECGKRYLVVTEPDGAHFKAEDFESLSSERGVVQRYVEMAGDEFVISSSDGDFVCKRLPSE